MSKETKQEAKPKEMVTVGEDHKPSAGEGVQKRVRIAVDQRQKRINDMRAWLTLEMSVSDDRLDELLLTHAFLKKGDFIAWVRAFKNGEARINESIDRTLREESALGGG
jgi:hypothetical protein